MSLDPSDQVTLRILRLLPARADQKACSLVCKRWLRLQGQSAERLRLLDWSMLENGRLAARFPNLTHLDATPAWSNASDPGAFGAVAVYMTRGSCTMRIDPQAEDPLQPNHPIDQQSPDADSFDRGLKKLVAAYPALKSLHVVDVFRPRERRPSRRRVLLSPTAPQAKAGPVFELVARENGLASDVSGTNSSVSSSSDTSGTRSPLDRELWESLEARQAQGLEIVAQGLPTLQELTVCQCMDASLEALASAGGCPHLQLVHLVGALPGFYHAGFSDTGLKRLARCCPRMVELWLSHCDVGLEGLAAVAKGCPMLSELRLGGSTFAYDWLQALCLFPNLQVLRLEDFAQPDAERCGSAGHGLCPSVQQVQFVRCNLRSAHFFSAFLRICHNVLELHISYCRRFSDATFRLLAQGCRHIRRLEIEGCPMVTTAGLEVVVLSKNELQHLAVRNCLLVRESEMSEALASAMFRLKVLKWEPTTSPHAGSLRSESRRPCARAVGISVPLSELQNSLDSLDP